MVSKLGKQGLIILAGAALLVVLSVVAAGVGWTWLAVAGIGMLQLAVLGVVLMLRWSVGKPFSAMKSVDALSERMMAAIETERLEALDRHAELMAAVGDRTNAR